MKNRPTARGTLPADSMFGVWGTEPNNSLLIDAPFPQFGFLNSLLDIPPVSFRAFFLGTAEWLVILIIVLFVL